MIRAAEPTVHARVNILSEPKLVREVETQEDGYGRHHELIHGFNLRSGPKSGQGRTEPLVRNGTDNRREHRHQEGTVEHVRPSSVETKEAPDRLGPGASGPRLGVSPRVDSRVKNSCRRRLKCWFFELCDGPGDGSGCRLLFELHFLR